MFFTPNETQLSQAKILAKLIEGKTEEEIRSTRDGIVIMSGLTQQQLRAEGDWERIKKVQNDMQTLTATIDKKLFQMGCL